MNYNKKYFNHFGIRCDSKIITKITFNCFLNNLNYSPLLANRVKTLQKMFKMSVHLDYPNNYDTIVNPVFLNSLEYFKLKNIS